MPISRESSALIASGATTSVAVLNENFSPDLDSLVAAVAGDRSNVTTTMTANGYDIVDMSACENSIAGAARP